MADMVPLSLPRYARQGELMINVFVLQNGRLSQVNIDSRDDLARASPVWVDLTDPDEEERDWVRGIYGVTLPDEDEVKDIEASARYYEGEGHHCPLRSSGPMPRYP